MKVKEATKQNETNTDETNTNEQNQDTTTPGELNLTAEGAGTGTESEVKPGKAAEITYSINVDEINEQRQGMFKTMLVERLNAIAEGQPVSSEAVPVFRTTYKPNPFGPDVEQYWTAFMGEGYPESFSAYDMLIADGDTPNVDVLAGAVSAFKDADIKCLHFMPLTGPKISPVVPVYAQARGTASDKSPFVIHTKPLGRIIARVNGDRFEFAPVDGQLITDHMQKILNRWFGEQLAQILTPEFLCTVFSTAAAAFLHRSINVAGLRKQLDEIEKVGQDLVNHL